MPYTHVFLAMIMALLLFTGGVGFGVTRFEPRSLAKVIESQATWHKMLRDAADAAQQQAEAARREAHAAREEAIATRQELQRGLASVLDAIRESKAAQSEHTQAHAQGLRDTLREEVGRVKAATDEAINTLSSGVGARLDQLQHRILSAPPAAPTLPPHAKPPPAAAAPTELANLRSLTASMAPHAPPPSPPPVFIVFRFPGGGELGATASLYWLSHVNATEHLYSEIPEGKSVTETTLPGECWRVRDTTSGNHLLSRYCATEEKRQVVDIKPQHSVHLDFHYYDAGGGGGGAPLAARTIELYAEAAVPTGPRSLLGRMPCGGHFSTQVHAGARVLALESGTGRQLAQYTATPEARQFVTLGSDAVHLEFISPRDATGDLAIFEQKGGDVERLRHSKLAPGQAVRLPSAAGERWVVREAASDATVLVLTAGTLPRQRIQLEPKRRVGS